MTTDIQNVVKFLKEHDNYVILMHVHPDGDALGSGFALREALRQMGKTVSAVCADKPHSKFDYMGTVDEIPAEYDTVISVDLADTKLLGKEYEAVFGDKVELSIDHHGSNRLYAKQTLLDAKASAACEIILQVVRELGVEFTKSMAQCIYTGISTDTGCFRYSNVTPRTMRMGAEMIECGAENAKINTLMFETKTRTYMELEKLAMNSMKMYLDGKVAFITITQDMFRQSGSDESETDGIASLPRQVEGVWAGVTMREKEDGTFKISMRTSEELDASAICAMMNGGGHPRAAGCSLSLPMEQATQTVLECIEEHLNNK